MQGLDQGVAVLDEQLIAGRAAQRAHLKDHGAGVLRPFIRSGIESCQLGAGERQAVEHQLAEARVVGLDLCLQRRVQRAVVRRHCVGGGALEHRELRGLGSLYRIYDAREGYVFLAAMTPAALEASLAAYEMLPAQVQVVNGLFILILVPIFTFGIYPLLGKFFEVTPLRKIGMGFFVVAASFLIVAWIEQRIQSGFTVSMWWQITAYAVLTAAEVLVSITALEYSYKQAPLYMKSFIMALFLLSTSVGNAFTAAVNTIMVKPLTASAMQVGDSTWVTLEGAANFVTGQKIDFAGETGVQVLLAEGKTEILAGTYLVGEVDAASSRLRLLDKVYRQPLRTSGVFEPAKAEVSTYALVGPIYFLFFAALMAAAALLYIFYAMWFKETTFVREDVVAQAA